MPFLKARPAKVFSPYVCVYYDLSLAFSVSYEMNKEQKNIGKYPKVDWSLTDFFPILCAEKTTRSFFCLNNR